MDTIATTARQEAVMATIADLIVAAAAGKTLRVAVGGTHPHETAFADQLAQALRSRGRPSHRRTAKPRPVSTDGYPRASGDADVPTVAVITSGTPGPDETDLCRVNIQLYRPTRVTAPASAHREPDGQDQGTGGHPRPDVILDDLDPGGLTIRYLGPALTGRPGHHRAGYAI
jgi:hypothetical protein